MTLQFETQNLTPDSNDPEVGVLPVQGGVISARTTLLPEAFDGARTQILSNPSLVGYWKLEDNATVMGAEVGPNGTFSAATTWQSGGPITGLCPSAFYPEINGTTKFGSVPFAAAHTWGKANPFTIEWFGRHDGTLAAVMSRLFEIGGGLAQIGLKVYYAETASDELTVEVISTIFPAQTTNVRVSFGSHSTATWYKYAIVFTGPTGAPGEFTLYRDGVAGTVVSSTGGAFTNDFLFNNTTLLGTDLGILPGATGADHDMAQLAFYDTALAPADLVANAVTNYAGPLSGSASWDWVNAGAFAADIQIIGARGALGRAKQDNGAFTEELHTRFFYSVNAGPETEFEPNDLLPSPVSVPVAGTLTVRVEFHYDESFATGISKATGYLTAGPNLIYEDNVPLAIPPRRVAFPVNFSAELLP